MPNYKSPDNKVHHLDDEAFEYLLPAGSVEITEQEADAIITPPRSLAELKADKLNELDAAYEVAIQQSVSYMGTTFQADEASQLLVTKVLSAGSVPAGFFWLDANNVKVPMTPADLQGLAGVMLIQGQTNFAKKTTLKEQARAALTDAELALIVW